MTWPRHLTLQVCFPLVQSTTSLVTIVNTPDRPLPIDYARWMSLSSIWPTCTQRPAYLTTQTTFATSRHIARFLQHLLSEQRREEQLVICIIMSLVIRFIIVSADGLHSPTMPKKSNNLWKADRTIFNVLNTSASTFHWTKE